jgi:hypothetical protein
MNSFKICFVNLNKFAKFDHVVDCLLFKAWRQLSFVWRQLSFVLQFRLMERYLSADISRNYLYYNF